jgi:threonine dehydrogenase-like Zn-dependent dehydrogenase
LKAVVRRGKQLLEVERQEIQPGAGQVLVSSLACGICGSDLHLMDLEMPAEKTAGSDASTVLDLSQDLVMGHEFCAQILEHGPGCRQKLQPGTRVVSVPYAMGPSGLETVGFSTRYPGGFGERMVLTEDMLLEVPNGLPDSHAALTEPMAVGTHAVATANLSEQPVALVIGCGPVGLAVIAALKHKGVGPIIACDYAEGRRELAQKMGADIIIDPSQNSPHGLWSRFDVPATVADLSRASLAGRSVRKPLIFECVGAPGLLQSIIQQGPPLAQVVVVGSCNCADTIVPVLALQKQLRFDFVYAYTPAEFAATLDNIAEGRIDVAPLVSRVVGRSGVAPAFTALANPGQLVKVVIDPRQP